MTVAASLVLGDHTVFLCAQAARGFIIIQYSRPRNRFFAASNELTRSEDLLLAPQMFNDDVISIFTKNEAEMVTRTTYLLSDNYNSSESSPAKDQSVRIKVSDSRGPLQRSRDSIGTSGDSELLVCIDTDFGLSLAAVEPVGRRG